MPSRAQVRDLVGSLSPPSLPLHARRPPARRWTLVAPVALLGPQRPCGHGESASAPMPLRRVLSVTIAPHRRIPSHGSLRRSSSFWRSVFCLRCGSMPDLVVQLALFLTRAIPSYPSAHRMFMRRSMHSRCSRARSPSCSSSHTPPRLPTAAQPCRTRSPMGRRWSTARATWLECRAPVAQLSPRRCLACPWMTSWNQTRE